MLKPYRDQGSYARALGRVGITGTRAIPGRAAQVSILAFRREESPSLGIGQVLPSPHRHLHIADELHQLVKDGTDSTFVNDVLIMSNVITHYAIKYKQTTRRASTVAAHNLFKNDYRIQVSTRGVT